MSNPLNSIKIRIVVSIFFTLTFFLILISRLGVHQIVNGDELRKKALAQWSKDIKIRPERGIIYDRKGIKRLAISVNGFRVACSPKDIKDEDIEETVKQLAEILELNEEEITNKIIAYKEKEYVKIKEWVEKEEADILNDKNLNGVIIIPNTKRYYPFENLASHILGFTDIDNRGLYGIENSYNKFLSGIPGRLVINVDVNGRRLPYDNERIIDAEQGASIILTIDETIQHFVEKAAEQAMNDYEAKNATIVIMEPKTGDILAFTFKPDFNLNDPRIPMNDKIKSKWDNMTQEELEHEWNNLWKPHPITDVYEPGSTFKVITAAAALEEKVVSLDTEFYCNGYVRDIPGGIIKCWSYTNPHGDETFLEGMQNSCNPVFVEVSKRLGKEKFMKYVKAFGIGEKTGIDLVGEVSGIVPDNVEKIKDIRLATMSFGQGISVTSIQLISAISAIANEGNLMKPRITKNILDKDGKIIEEFQPEIIRKVISKETSDEILYMLETTVTEGTAKHAYVPGYRVGGKTGTAEKVVDGKYSKEKFIASFVGIAPINDPQIAVLVMIDEPNPDIDIHGGKVAAPVAGKVIEYTLKYLNVEPQFN